MSIGMLTVQIEYISFYAYYLSPNITDIAIVHIIPVAISILNR